MTQSNVESTSRTQEFQSLNTSILVKTVWLSINLITNILICLTVFVCIVYACSSTTIDAYHLHIILCVLGYQFFMCQGIMVLSKYNSWSLFLKRIDRRRIHFILQTIAVVLVTVGSCLIIREKNEHFNTIHGSVGLCALITSLTSLANGILVTYANRLSRLNVFWIKFIHYVTGVCSIFLSAFSLCAAFRIEHFSMWTGNIGVDSILIFITCLFTVFVSINFWIFTGNIICKLCWSVLHPNL
ncbi:hypothetical protein O3G_MSEX007406 [Manduca sexta]|uniref:ascorbate ferrireductase (transmembrane) n=1 Tax=Manduca sexta TaxID=7130 RepID=A0A921Z6A2_MANSE|nr:hypothetical protein O3G_MSEX007406 [Manduca sexta]